METVDKDLIVAKYKKRIRIMSVIMGLMVFLAFIFLLYAFVQRGIAEENMRLAEEKAIQATQNAVTAASLQTKLEQCAEEARAAQRLAEKVAEEARRAQQEAHRALQKALKK